MQHKDFVGLQMRQLAADLLKADQLAEMVQVDHSLDLKRRVCEDLEQALREHGQLSEQQAFWLNWAKS